MRALGCNEFSMRTTNRRVEMGTWFLLVVLLISNKESLENTVCEKPSNPKNGVIYFTDDSVDTGSQIEYICDEHYIMEPLTSQFAICTVSGHWSKPQPRCITISCPQPKQILNGRLIREDGLLNMYQSTIRYECDKGYRIVGPRFRKCQSDRTWSGNDTKCEEIACEKPSPPENGKVYLNDTSLKVGSQIEYTCDELHIMEPTMSKSAVCTVYGNWSNPQPRCLKICKVRDLSHGSIIPISGFLRTLTEDFYVHDNTELNFTCNDGYESYASGYETLGRLKCFKGALLPGSPECRPKRCIIEPTTNLEYFIRQEKVLENIIHSGIVTNVRCSNRAELFRSSSYLETDQINVKCNLGKLEPESPVCKDKRCNIITTIDNGHFINNGKVVITGEKISSGSNITLICSEGYELYNKTNSRYLDLVQTNIKCYQGSFTSETPSCKPKRCNIITTIDNGHFINNGKVVNTGEKISSGSNITLICSEGYELYNKTNSRYLDLVQTNIKCYQGSFTSETPSCKPTIVSVEIRLTGGSGHYEGRLEVNYNGTWGTVCDDSFDTTDGAVVCRQLGYPGTGVITKSTAFFGPGSGPIWLDDLNCTGLENNLIRCGHRGWGINGCGHGEDASVICPYNLPNIQIRLAGGPNNQQGRVEIQYNGQWGTVCDNHWSASDAAVACRMLGLPFDGAVPVSLAAYGIGSGPILMDEVKCIGREATLAACQFSGWTISNCSHTEDAGVICQSSTASVEIRLTGGSGPYEGRLEVNYNGIWGTVCDDNFDTMDGAVVCRQLGYPGTGVITNSGAYFGPGSGPVWLDELDCTGLENNLIRCGHRGWGRNNCNHSEDASVICPSIVSVEIRLTGGSGHYEGRLEVNYNGTWGTVCDDRFDTTDGAVVCRQLGYPGTGVITKSTAFFGPGSGPIWLDDLNCTGLENNLIRCGHRGWGINNCHHGEDASVICPYNLPNIQIRLAGGPNNQQGRVEIQYNGQWGTVCDDHWSASDAAVACRMLGLPFDGAVPVSEAAYGIGSGPILMDEVKCIGREATLAACQFSGWTISDCSHTEDAGVICQSSIVSVEIRLTGGSGHYEGRLEVNYNGTWGTVCDDRFDTTDGAVVCRQLGYPGTGVITNSGAYFGPGSGPVWLDELDCTGLENNLIRCGHRGWGRNDCNHSEDASVICPSIVSVEIRLTGGSGHYEGRLEVNYNGTWGTVCDDRFDTTDGAVVCRQLGYPGTGVITKSTAFFGPGSGPIWLDDLNCTGLENNLIRCGHRGWGINNCRHGEDASVICPYNLPNIQIRLAGGPNNQQGRVEIQYNGQWGTVCDNHWSASDAAVACRMLGLPFDGAVPVSLAAYGIGSGPILMDEVKCIGREATLAACQFSGWTISDCSHTEDAGVICQSSTASVEIRLTGGSGPYEGRLEVNYNGIWGTVCDDNFDTMDGAVVCRQLGYPGTGVITNSGAYFGPGSGPVWLDELDCTGLENNLIRCGHRGWGRNNCNHSEDASVICPCQNQNPMVRLSGGLRQSQGRVEVLYDGAWGTVCDDNFDDNAATVVCRMLCYTGNVFVARTGGFFGAGSGSILLDDVICNRNETSIVNCRHNPWGHNDCTHKEDAGVDCQASNLSNIQIRLAGGPNNQQGRVEIQYKGQWGTVCDDHWSAPDAAVACRMLGLPSDGAVPVRMAAYGIGSGPILMDDVKCIGTEATLAACQFSGWTISDCSHTDDAAVICQSSTASIQIRLAGGSEPYEGRLEVNYNGTWGTVCDDSFDTSDGVVVCRQLGYPGTGVMTKSHAFFGPGSGPIWLSQLECTGLENNLIRCGHIGWGRSGCGHREDVSVICPY